MTASFMEQRLDALVAAGDVSGLAFDDEADVAEEGFVGSSMASIDCTSVASANRSLDVVLGYGEAASLCESVG